MAHKICGESRLTVGARTVRLRLDIGTMMDLEDHLGTGLVTFLAGRFQEFRLKDLACFYAAMIGTDFTDETVLEKAAGTLVKVGIVQAAEAISACFEAALTPPASDQKKGKS